MADIPAYSAYTRITKTTVVAVVKTENGQSERNVQNSE